MSSPYPHPRERHNRQEHFGGRLGPSNRGQPPQAGDRWSPEHPLSLGLGALALGAGALLVWYGASQYASTGEHDRSQCVAVDETEDLIASNKVEGTPIYDGAAKRSERFRT